MRFVLDLGEADLEAIRVMMELQRRMPVDRTSAKQFLRRRLDEYMERFVVAAVVTSKAMAPFAVCAVQENEKRLN